MEKSEQSIAQELLEKFNDKDGLGSADNAKFFAALLNLPDDEFTIAAGAFLAQLEKEYQNSETRAAMAQDIRDKKINYRELSLAFKEIEGQLQGELPNLPKNKVDFVKQVIMLNLNAINDIANEAGKLILIPIEINNDGKMPTYANLSDAGADVYAAEDLTIKPGETKLLSTGIKVALPLGYELQIRPKSGISLKTKLRIANSPATIDSEYRGEIKIIIDNIEPPIKDITYDFDEQGRPIITSILHGSEVTISKGQKIAQLVVSEVISASYKRVEKILSNTTRGEGGFGSTGLF